MTRVSYPLLCALLLPSAAASAETVNVLYAGSLVNLMEHGVGPAFEKASGEQFQGYAGGFERDRQPDQGEAPPRRRIHQRQSEGQR